MGRITLFGVFTPNLLVREGLWGYINGTELQPEPTNVEFKKTIMLRIVKILPFVI